MPPTRRWLEALAAYQQAIAVAPDWHGLHNGAGWSYLKLGRTAEARAAFARALSLRPDYADAARGLSLARL